VNAYLRPNLLGSSSPFFVNDGLCRCEQGQPQTAEEQEMQSNDTTGAEPRLIIEEERLKIVRFPGVQ